MQHRSLSSVEDRLSFDVVVPKMTSTRHVAAAAFYHCLGEQKFLRPVVITLRFFCLVLATKDLIRLEQVGAYDPVLIKII